MNKSDTISKDLLKMYNCLEERDLAIRIMIETVQPRVIAKLLLGTVFENASEYRVSEIRIAMIQVPSSTIAFLTPHEDFPVHLQAVRMDTTYIRTSGKQPKQEANQVSCSFHYRLYLPFLNRVLIESETTLYCLFSPSYRHKHPNFDREFRHALQTLKHSDHAVSFLTFIISAHQFDFLKTT